MLTQEEIKIRFEKVFPKKQAVVLTDVFVDYQDDLVKSGDFNELKGIVKELAEAQKELAEAQKETNRELKELAEAQKETQKEIQKLTIAIDDTRTNLGGLSDSVGYSLENEAYRGLPAYLREKHGIEVTERFIRTEIGGEEINILGIGKKDGVKVLIVGEAELKLRSVSKFTQLDRKVSAVRREYKEDIIKILITHYASPSMIEKAKEKGIIVIQSFEWS